MSTTHKKPSRLAGRTLYVPRMSYSGCRALAAVFRSAGVDTRLVEPSDQRTLALGGEVYGGEECYPAQVTLGDFLKILQSDGFDPDKVAFFLPTAEGPCRFGQYVPCLQQILEQMGYSQIPIINPTSEDDYQAGEEGVIDVSRDVWRSIVASDILRKLLLKTRPYETESGAADAALDTSLRLLEEVLENPDLSDADRMAALTQALLQARQIFRNVPAHYSRDRPLIGVVGEIFCRLSRFSNQDLVRKIEKCGGEVWLSDVGEWIWYTGWYQRLRLKQEGKRLSRQMLAALMRNRIQQSDHDKLLQLFEDEFVGYEEPHDIYGDLLEAAWPYLPADSSLGEMVLSIGKSIYLQQKGADGIIDISPFGCMNGIVCEALYPTVSRDHGGIPIRSVYFDASEGDAQDELEIFMELARSYRQRKCVSRVYPDYFEPGCDG